MELGQHDNLFCWKTPTEIRRGLSQANALYNTYSGGGSLLLLQSSCGRGEQPRNTSGNVCRRLPFVQELFSVCSGRMESVWES